MGWNREKSSARLWGTLFWLLHRFILGYHQKNHSLYHGSYAWFLTMLPGSYWTSRWGPVTYETSPQEVLGYIYIDVCIHTYASVLRIFAQFSNRPQESFGILIPQWRIMFQGLHQAFELRWVLPTTGYNKLAGTGSNQNMHIMNADLLLHATKLGQGSDLLRIWLILVKQ